MASSTVAGGTSIDVELRERFDRVRQRSLEICAPLTPEDMMVQSCPEASPAKWHLAHTAWFFESFLLREFLPGYRPFHEDFRWLFNSYYESYAAFPDKQIRASFSRPGVEAILDYREHVDEGIRQLLSRDIPGNAPEEALRRIELGLHHEEQHQELLLTDIQHALFTNPLQPAYQPLEAGSAGRSAPAMSFLDFGGGLVEIGVSFDNERPRHRVWLQPFQLASRLVTCGEFAEFMADRGYERAELWLSAGWDTIKAKGWRAPLYWQKEPNGRQEDWTIATLRGKRRLEEVAGAPVAHVSYFEADAYARWRGLRLATEAEWEYAAAGQSVAGNLYENQRLTTTAAASGPGLQQIWGDCWEWTASAYLGYPGFEPLNGALGEYNGKFMSGQMVLRGGSCITPTDHIRASYRNFFPPETRWQFSGIRLVSK
jgi:ergothioneine biosynthesis protein EgtB